jgi:hypothetical protein
MTKKEQEEAKKRKLMIIIFAVIMIGIMVIVPLATLFNPTSLHNAQTSETTKTRTFNTIQDALTYLPSSASYVRFVNLSTNDVVTSWAKANIGSNLPNTTLFGMSPYRDVVASFPYPSLSMTIIDDPQVVVLTDFGKGYDNANYTKTSINGYEMRVIQSPYAFSTDSYPTILGREEYVALIDNFIQTTTTTASTAYSTYSGLLAQANQSDAAFATVGITDYLGFGDLYYAGITPINDTMCDYKIVVHLNQTLNESQMQNIALQWQAGAALYGIETASPQFKDNYVILAARGDIESCLNDMISSNWYFIIG